MDEALRGLTYQQERRLARSLACLTNEQTTFVRDALQRARREGRVTVRELGLLEHCFERWWTHSLATKMAVLDRIAALSGSESWPRIWTGHPARQGPAGGLREWLWSTVSGPPVASPVAEPRGRPETTPAACPRRGVVRPGPV
jgi:hypothetical protein